MRLVGGALGVAVVAAAAPAGLAVTPADPCALTLRDPGRMLDRHVSPALLARVFAPGQRRDGAIDVGARVNPRAAASMFEQHGGPP